MGMVRCEYTTEIDKTLSKCCYCGSTAKIIHYDWDIWYVECSNLNCKKHLPYAYMGLKKNIAIDNWEYANRKINVKSRKK